MLDIDVLIVTHRGGQLLEKCLESVRGQTVAPRKILVVFSSDSPAPATSSIEIIRTKQPCDFAPAANLGLRELGEKPVVLLNDDTVMHRTCLQALINAYTGPGIYQPRILRPDGTVDNTGHWVFVDGFNVARDRGSMDERPPDHCGAFSGAAVMFSPEVLAQVGVFDGDFGAYGEDLDLSLRAIRQGFSIQHVPRAHVTHELGATYGRSSPRKVFLIERNRIHAAIRSLPFSAVMSLPITSTFRLGLMGTAAMTGTGLGASAGWKGALAAIAGLTAGMLSAPRAFKKRRKDQKKWTSNDHDMWAHMRAQAPPLDQLAGVNIKPPSRPPTIDQ